MSAKIPEWLEDAIVRAKRGPHRADASEFSRGGGLTPPGLEDATEADGGRYRGRTPAVALDVRMARGTAGKPGGPWIKGR